LITAPYVNDDACIVSWIHLS